MNDVVTGRPRRTLRGRLRTTRRWVTVFFWRLLLGRLSRDICFKCCAKQPGRPRREGQHPKFPDLYDCGCICGCADGWYPESE